MRRFVIVTLAITAVLVASSPASAARLRVYRGQTSAGTKIAFLVRVADDGRMSLKEMRYRVEMVCEDASTIDYDSWWGFGGVGVRFEVRSLRSTSRSRRRRCTSPARSGPRSPRAPSRTRRPRSPMPKRRSSAPPAISRGP